MLILRLAMIIALAAACKSPESNCVPGELRECPCSAGPQGAQTCEDSGTRYGECQCAAPNDASTDAVVDGEPAIDAEPACGDGTSTAGELCLGAAVHITVGEEPTALTHADFNEDGHEDLVVAAAASRILLLLSTGPAAFGEPVAIELMDATSLAVGDFDQDGHWDLVVGRQIATNSVTVLWGDGLGGFPDETTLPNTISLSVGPVVVADFNNDGFEDIAAASALILTYTGERTFSLQGRSAGQHGITVADFDLDGNLDVVSGGGSNGGYLTTSIFLGNGLGGIALPVQTPAVTCSNGCVFVGFATGKFDADDFPEIALSTAGQQIAVLLGDGGTQFHAPDVYTVGQNPQSVVVNDLNSDGRQDIVAPNFGSDNVALLLGLGAGLFEPASVLSTLPGGRKPIDVVLLDLNEDGQLDVVTANFLTDNVSIFLSNP